MTNTGEVTFEVKNYRCFPDQNPLRFNLEPCITALVGENNSGKSALLKLFYELRPIFTLLYNTGILHSLFLNRPYGAESTGVTESSDIFSNSNDRPLAIRISLPSTAEFHGALPELKSALLSASRESLGKQWNAEFDWSKPISRRADFNESNSKITPDGRLLFGGNEMGSVARFLAQADVLRRIFYIGPFRSFIPQSQGSHFDLTVGTGLVDSWNSWHTGNNKVARKRAIDVVRGIQQMFGFNSFSINAAQSGAALLVDIDGKPYTLHEIGTGISQVIGVIVQAAMREPKPSYILIDEPELNLHPKMQMDFLNSLASYAEFGLLFTTHNIGLARSCGDQIFSVSRNRDSGASSVREFEGSKNFSEIAGNLSYSSFHDHGSRRIVLVEGHHDVKTIGVFLRMFRKAHEFVTISLGGDERINGKVAHELSEFGRLSDKISVIIDSEKDSSTARLAPNREDFIRICQGYQWEICVLERRSIENYLTQGAVQEILGPRLNALSEYEAVPDQWDKRKNWLIAGRMQKSDIESTDLGKFISGLQV